MRRFALTLLLVSLAALLAGVVLGTFVLGGRGLHRFSTSNRNLAEVASA